MYVHFVYLFNWLDSDKYDIYHNNIAIVESRCADEINVEQSTFTIREYH